MKLEKFYHILKQLPIIKIRINIFVKIRNVSVNQANALTCAG